MSKRILTYNGIDLSTFGAHVSGEGVWAKPAPEYERISVPGRSGDVLLYNGRYSNVDITYRFGITKNFDTNYTNLIAALLGSPGYHKLVDSKHPGVYRMAAIDRGIEPNMLPQLSAGEFEVTFNCKPQIYLDSGDEAATWYSDLPNKFGLFTNPTDYIARPLIVITLKTAQPDAFSIRIGDTTGSSISYKYISYTAFDSDSARRISNPITYDAETNDIYDSNGSLNDQFTINKEIFISGRSEGNIYSSFPEIVYHAKIYPRWWKL